MRAFHSNWTKPFFCKHIGEYYIEDFELLTTILSALKWQEYNGDIQMVTDKIGAAYYRKLGLENIWNLGIDDTLEDKMTDNISPSTFWAAGKIYALEKQTVPCVMMDTDFIVWQSVKEELEHHRLSVIHREKIDECVYPNRDKLVMNEQYTYNEDWNWQAEACNTAFSYFGYKWFKDYYVNESIRFMKSAIGEDPLIYMVFAEQRLLAMCAEEKQMDLYALSNMEELFKKSQKRFTHVWGYKRYIRSNSKAREQFCKKCIRRIKNDFPNEYPLLYGIESLASYLNEI